MKRILFIFFVLASFVALAQRPPNYVPRNTNEAILRQWVDSTFTAPAGVNPSLRLGPGRAGPVFVDTVGGNKGFHYYRDGAFIRLVDTTMTTLFGSTITNIGNGFDLAVSGTNNIKKFRDSLYFKLDSSVSGTLRGYLDTANLFTSIRNTISPSAGFTQIGRDFIIANDSLKMYPWINVEDLGAVADGVTDCYPAFQAAANTGKNLLAPSNGTYYLSQTVQLKNGQTLFGYGWNTIIKVTANTAAVALDSNSHVRGLKFIGNGRNGTGDRNTGVVVSNAVRWSIKDCYFEDFAGDPILEGGGGVFIDSLHTTFNEGGSVLNCVFRNNDGGLVIGQRGEYVIVDAGNHFFKNNVAILVGSSNVVISNNTLDSNIYAIKNIDNINAAHNVVTGNLINHNIFPIWIEDCPFDAGYEISNNMIIFGTIKIINSSNIKFSNNHIVALDSIVLDQATFLTRIGGWMGPGKLGGPIPITYRNSAQEFNVLGATRYNSNLLDNWIYQSPSQPDSVQFSGPLLGPRIYVKVPAGDAPLLQLLDGDVELPPYFPLSPLHINSIANLTSGTNLFGGLQLNGYTEKNADSVAVPLYLQGFHGNNDPTAAAIDLVGNKWDSATSVTILSPTEKVLQISNGTSSVPGYSHLITVLGNGNTGFGTEAPDPSAIVDMSTTTKGLLAPRMNTTQQNAVVSPATGLLIYNTDSSMFRFFDGSLWKSIAAGGGASVSSITGTANQIAASAATGAVTLSIPSVFSAPGTITAATGFTVTTGGATITAGGLTITAGGALITAGGLTVTAGATTLTPLNSIGIVVNSAAGVLSSYAATDHGLQVGNATGQIASLGLGTAGQVLTSNGAGADPSWQAAGGGGSYTNGYGLNLVSTTFSVDSTKFPDKTQSNVISGAYHFSTAPRPGTAGGADLGTTSLGWGNHYLATGKKIDFNNGDITLTHATDLLTLGGGSFEIDAGNRFRLSSSNVTHGMTTLIPTNVYTYFTTYGTNSGGFQLRGLTDADFTGAAIIGTIGVTSPTAPAVIIQGSRKSGTTEAALTGTETILDVLTTIGSPLYRFQANGAFIPGANDGSVLGNTTRQWSDLFLAEGAVINFDNGDATITQVGNVVTLAGAALNLAVAAEDNTATKFMVKADDGTVGYQNIQTVSNDAVPDSLDGAKFTPTLVDNPAGYNSNVSSSANVTAYYHKIGNIVTVWGTITAVATAGSTNSAVAVTLPIASNLAANDVTGGAKWNVTVGVNYTDLDGAVNTDATNDRVVIGWNSHAATSDHNIFYRYTYQVK